MTGDEGTPAPGPDAGIDELRADIENTRAQLGETVSALGSKFDVKGRAADKVTSVKTKVISGAHTVTENARVYPAVPAAFAVGVTALILGVVLWRRYR